MRRLPLLAVLFASRALAADGDLVQTPEIAAPERGSLAGLYAQSAASPSALAQGSYSLPSPLAAPKDRGALPAAIFPHYSPDAGLSEWGMGWTSSLEIRRWRAAGDLDFASDDLMSPWGRLVAGQDGAYYPLGLATAVRVDGDGAGGLVAYLPDGSRWLFGGTTIDRDATHRYAWCLREIDQADGRRTTLDWLTNTSGRPFLSAVQWGGVSDPPQYRIDLVYQALPSQLPFLDFSSGRELDLDRRVATVVVSARTAGGWAERWRYGLSHQQDEWGVAFYLTEVQQSFPSGAAPPPVRYSYRFAADQLAQASFAPIAALDPLLARYGADLVDAEHTATTDADLDGRIDLEEHTTNVLLLQRDGGFDQQPLPPAGTSTVPTCRPAASSPTPELVPPRQLVRLRPGDDTDRVLGFAFDGFQTTLDVCALDGSRVGTATLAGDWQPSPTLRVVDANRDHQPDLVSITAGGYAILENTSAAGYAWGALHTGTLLPAEFQPLAVWVHDMNGDGIADLVARDGTSFLVWFGKGGFEFEPQGQTLDVRTLGGFALPSLDGYGFYFVDANRDGLADLLLTQGGQVSLFVNTGAFFQQTTVPALDGLGADASLPFVGDLAGSGNTEIAIVRGGHAESVMLDTAGTGLLATADDGRGTVLHYSYARGPAAPGAVHRPAVLAGIDVESSGYADISYRYSFRGPHSHSIGRFLLGYDDVVRASATAATEVQFLNQDAFAGVLAQTRDTSTLVPALAKRETREYTVTSFEGVIYPQPRAERTSLVGAAGAVTHSVEHDGYVGLCPLVSREIGVAGTLQTDRTIYALPAFAKHLMCQSEWLTMTGRHAVASLDFTLRTHIVRNEIGLPVRIDNVDAAGDTFTQQTVEYAQPGYLPVTISVAGKGTSRLEYSPAGILDRVTSPTGVVTEVPARDERTDATLAIAQHQGGLVYTRRFGFDGLERLLSQSDDFGAQTSYAYRYPQLSIPGSIAVTNQVDAGSIARTIELQTARGEPVTTAAALASGWMLGPVAIRTPDAGRTDHVLAAAALAQDPAAASYADLVAGAPTIDSDVQSSLGVDVASTTALEQGVVRGTTTRVDVQRGLVRRLLTENGARTSEIDADAGGHTWRFVDPAGTAYGYRWDALGRLRDVALPDGTHHSVAYDGHGRIARIVRDGIATIDRAYDPASGLVTAETLSAPGSAAVRRTQWTYDAAGRVQTETHIDLSSGETRAYQFSYGLPGLLTQVSGPGFERSFTYRSDGKPLQKTLVLDGWRSIVTDFAYHADGSESARTITVRDANGAMLESIALGSPVDALGRSAGVTLGGAAIAELGYDALGQPQTIALSDGTRVGFVRDPLTRTQLGHTRGATRYELHHDARGLVATETFDFGGGAITRQYGYADSGFLTAVTANAGDQYGYEFDGFGLPQAITQNGSRRTLVRTPGGLQAGAVGYQLDALGRTIGKGDLALAYGPDGQVAAATRGSSHWRFAYDESGKRLLKSSDACPIAAFLDEGYLDPSGLVVPIRVAGQLVGIVQGGRFRALDADVRGTVLADQSGTPHLPSPFGDRAIHPDVAAALDYALSGWDADLGVVRMGARDYDPAIARFFTPDPLYLADPARAIEHPISANLYAYGEDDPLRHVDPSGTDAVYYDHQRDLHPLLTGWISLGRFSTGLIIDFRSWDVYAMGAGQVDHMVDAHEAAKPGLWSRIKDLRGVGLTVSVPYTIDPNGTHHYLLHDDQVRHITDGNAIGAAACRGRWCAGFSHTLENDGGTFDLGGTFSKEASVDVTLSHAHFIGNPIEWLANKIYEGTHPNWQLNNASDRTWNLFNNIYPQKGWYQQFAVDGTIVTRGNPSAAICEPGDIDSQSIDTSSAR